jgi:hypothetical protein
MFYFKLSDVRESGAVLHPICRRLSDFLKSTQDRLNCNIIFGFIYEVHEDSEDNSSGKVF